MSMHHKIKRYKKGGGVYRARPHPVFVVFLVVLVAALVFLGTIIYQPVSNFIMSLGNWEPVVMEPSYPPESIGLSGVESLPDTVSEAEQQIPKPVHGVQAVYLPYSIANNNTDLDSFIEKAAQTGNAVMVDIKDSQGQVLFNTTNEYAVQWEGVIANPVDLRALSQKLKDKNLHLVVRMSLFSDPIAARGHRETNAILYQGSYTLWLDNTPDNGGKPWTHPYSDEVLQYNIQLASEAVDAGAALVVLDNVQFPNDVTNSATFGDTGGVSRSDAMSAFVAAMQSALEAKGARTAVYLPASAVINPESVPDTRYGGSATAILGSSVILGLQESSSAPGVLSEALSKAKESIPGETVIIPLLPGNVSEDIRKSAGDGDIILYSEDGGY